MTPSSLSLDCQSVLCSRLAIVEVKIVCFKNQIALLFDDVALDFLHRPPGCHKNNLNIITEIKK